VEPIRELERAGGMTELVLLMTMVAIAAALKFWLTPETARLQESPSVPGGRQTRRLRRIFAYHRVARALYVTNLGLGSHCSA